MKTPFRRLRRRTMHLILAGVACLSLALALFGPPLPVRHDVYDVLAVLDITQSMNVLDYRLDGKPASRLAFAKHALREGLRQLPCGSRLGLGVFTEHRTFVLITPVDVCRNRPELSEEIGAISGQMAWANASEIEMGLYGALKTAASVPGRPSLLFITDGHEAPPPNPALRPRFDGRRGEVRGVILGAGDAIPMPIPKIGPDGNSLGYWRADEVPQTDAYTQARASGMKHDEMADITGPVTPLPLDQPRGEEQLSALHARYLELLATETGLRYRRLADVDALTAALTDPSVARRERAYASMHWVWGGLALVALVLLCVPAPFGGSGRN